MVRRMLIIGRWVVEFLFCVKKYDVEGVLACLHNAGAPSHILDDAEALMRECDYDCGFTYSQVQEFRFINPRKHRAVVLIGPTSSGAEFLDTFVHELYHLGVAIASELGMRLSGESPAYLVGDVARDLADVVCRLGCDNCHKNIEL